jgi:3',5'-cyclic AMP phosphodiesterase CpdA
MEAAQPDLYLFSGDMVELGAFQDEWDAWFTASGDVFARKLLVPAHGNHEFLAQNYFAQLGLPGNEQWFAVEYGDMLIMSLNDTVSNPEDIQTLQVRFLEEELAATSARWKTAVHHQPAYSTCTRHGSDEVLRGDWEPVFEELGVDVVIAGHNHIYERSVPIREGVERPLGQGTLYLVSGGAGASLYQESEADWFNQVANPVEHYMIAEFSAEGVATTVYDSNDTVIDTFFLPAP